MKIAGYDVILNPNMVERIFTRKQTRKFTNTRWTKKYKNKYSKIVPSSQVSMDIEQGVVICHPETAKFIQIQMGMNRIKERPYELLQRKSVMYKPPENCFKCCTDLGLGIPKPLFNITPFV